ncbi:MAG: outer membrane beta-barrel protein [Candidatus Binatia bacterium]|nr:outer membrane beta-barrel protein [Candidatus Binatia bacterium]
MKGRRFWTLALVALVAGFSPALSHGEEKSKVLAGLDLGAAIPVEKTTDRLETGGTFSPYVAYMMNDYLGVMAQAQVVGFPNDNRPGIRDKDATWAFGFHAGPRIAEPLALGDLNLEAYQTFQVGVFTGLSGDTPISRTSWGFSTGGGINLLLSDALSVGAWARYNQLDQRVNPTNEVQFVTTGIGLTYLIPAE